MRKREKMKMRTKILIMIRDHGSCVVMLCRRVLALGELDQWQVLDCTITHVSLPVLRQSNGCFSFRLLLYIYIESYNRSSLPELPDGRTSYTDDSVCV